MDPMAQSQAREWLMMFTMWAFFGYVVYLVTITIRRKQRNAMQQHVLDKFASAKDFADFVQSPAGQKYVMSFADTATSSQSAILSSVRIGVVLLFTGLGLQFTNTGSATVLPLRIGIVLGCVGIGFLVSAAISFWLARKFQREAKE
jgi:hypothetical protein